MRILIVLAVSLLAACASAPPEHSTYLLRSDKGIESKQLSFDSGAYLGGLTLADYIDQPGLVLNQGQGKIHAARHHEWAEPLRVSLRQFLSTEISAQLGRDVPPYKPTAKADQRVDVSIDQLHGDANGEAVILAYWSVTTEEGTQTHQFSARVALSADGYDGLVVAEKNLLQQLATAIASTLKISE
jgi:uncharacterized lipoprotein YmbA